VALALEQPWPQPARFALEAKKPAPWAVATVVELSVVAVGSAAGSVFGVCQFHCADGCEVWDLDERTRRMICNISLRMQRTLRPQRRHTNRTEAFLAEQERMVPGLMRALAPVQGCAVQGRALSTQESLRSTLRVRRNRWQLALALVLSRVSHRCHPSNPQKRKANMPLTIA
jgi:hypothetical protein